MVSFVCFISSAIIIRWRCLVDKEGNCTVQVINTWWSYETICKTKYGLRGCPPYRISSWKYGIKIDWKGYVILYHIAWMYLSMSDLDNAARVSKRWYNLLKTSETLWKFRYLAKFSNSSFLVTCGTDVALNGGTLRILDHVARWANRCYIALVVVNVNI